jgi:hypothetical protein
LPPHVTVRAVLSSWVQITALLLAALWPVATSHAWLESAGIIHETAHDGHDADHEIDHDAADGHCRLEHSALALKAPALSVQAWLGPIALTLAAVATTEAEIHFTARCVSTAPPALRRTWQFSERAALPGRAPSCAA